MLSRLADRLQNLLSLLPGGVIVIDEDGRVREANPAACDMLGLPLEGELWRHVITRCFAPREDDGHEISLKDGRRLSIATRSLDAERRSSASSTSPTRSRVSSSSSR